MGHINKLSLEDKKLLFNYNFRNNQNYLVWKAIQRNRNTFIWEAIFMNKSQKRWFLDKIFKEIKFFLFPQRRKHNKNYLFYYWKGKYILVKRKNVETLSNSRYLLALLKK